MKKRNAFTLIEVLISIGLLGIILVALFSTVSMMRDSNEHLHGYLEKAKNIGNATKVLYLDIVSSDGNISIKKDEFTRLCINETRNTLYALSLAKVCWVVLKKDNTLARIEGNNYRLPTRFDDKVEVNPVMKGVEIFDVYHKKDKIVVFIKQKKQEPITFLIQGISKPIVHQPIQDTNTTRPNGNRANGNRPNRNSPNRNRPNRNRPNVNGEDPLRPTINRPNRNRPNINGNNPNNIRNDDPNRNNVRGFDNFPGSGLSGSSNAR